MKTYILVKIYILVKTFKEVRFIDDFLIYIIFTRGFGHGEEN